MDKASHCSYWLFTKCVDFALKSQHGRLHGRVIAAFSPWDPRFKNKNKHFWYRKFLSSSWGRSLLHIRRRSASSGWSIRVPLLVWGVSLGSLLAQPLSFTWTCRRKPLWIVKWEQGVLLWAAMDHTTAQGLLRSSEVGVHLATAVSGVPWSGIGEHSLQWGHCLLQTSWFHIYHQRLCNDDACLSLLGPSG